MLKESEWLLSGESSCYKLAQQTAGKLYYTKESDKKIKNKTNKESDILWDFPGSPVVRT